MIKTQDKITINLISLIKGKKSFSEICVFKLVQCSLKNKNKKPEQSIKIAKKFKAKCQEKRSLKKLPNTLPTKPPKVVAPT